MAPLRCLNLLSTLSALPEQLAHKRVSLLRDVATLTDVYKDGMSELYDTMAPDKEVPGA